MPLDLSGLPASPIDFMLDRMRAAGMKVGEITGRQTTIQGGTYQTRAANDAAKKREMNAFNWLVCGAALVVLSCSRFPLGMT